MNFIRKTAKLIIGVLVTIFILLLASCGDDSDSSGGISFSDNFSFLKIFDVGNELSGGDIYITMRVANVSTTSIRVFIIENGSANSLTTEQINEFGPSIYTSMARNGVEVKGTLGNIQTTASGSAITNGVSYQLMAYSTEDNQFSNPSAPFTLSDQGELKGDYVGTWDDNFYSNFAITASIDGAGGQYSGDFYYTGNFTACCGAATDGDISFQVNDIGQISGFEYNQNLITYMNGCPGYYTGQGQLEDELTLVINFSGEDCDGVHTGGIMRLTRLR